MTIYKKLLMLFLSLTFIPMLLVGYYAYQEAKNSLKYQILTKLESITDLKVKKIEAYFSERSSDAYTTSKSIFLIKRFEQLSRSLASNDYSLFAQTRAELDYQLKSYSEAYGYRDIMLVAPNGIIIYASNYSHFLFEFGKNVPELFNDLFQKSKKEISFSDVYREQNKPDSYLMVVAAPVKNQQDIFLGEIFFEMDMRFVYDLLRDKMGIGNTGETIIGKKTRDGAMFLNPLLHDPDAALKRTVKDGDKNGIPLLKAVNGETGSGIESDYHGNRVIAAWRPLPLMNWGMLVKMDISEAFDSITTIRNSMALVLLFSLIGGSWIVLTITRTITTPIINLTKTTKRVIKGDLSARADILSVDEIGDLSQNFNTMIEKLTSANTSLKDAQRIAHIGNWELNLVSGDLTWSEEIYKIFELDPNFVAPAQDVLLSRVHPEDSGYVRASRSDSGKLQSPYFIHYRLFFPDQRIKYVDELCETLFDAGSGPRRTVGIIHDVTAQRKAELEVLKLNEQLENRVIERTAQLETTNRELEAFSYSVSHDFRTPIRSIAGFSELLKKRSYAMLDEKSQHYLDVILESTDQMGRLIDDILSFIRIGHTEMMESVIDFAVLTRNAIKSLDNEIAGRNVIWKLNDLPDSKGDLSMMQLVITNLVSNALKFTQNLEKTEIEIGSRENENETIYFVKDNGVGFDMQYVGKLFGLFQRLHRRDDFPGNGVGLANVHRIIQRHGGRMWAEGKINEGATFYFTLPKK